MEAQAQEVAQVRALVPAPMVRAPGLEQVEGGQEQVEAGRDRAEAGRVEAGEERPANRASG